MTNGVDITRRPAVHLSFEGNVRPVAKRSESVFTRVALALGILMFVMMAVRIAPVAYNHFTMSPAPRPPAPQAVAAPSQAVAEAGRLPTEQVR